MTDLQRFRMGSAGLEPHPDGEWVWYEDIAVRPECYVRPGDVITLKDGRAVRVWQGLQLLRDHKGRIAVRSVATGRLSYMQERVLTEAKAEAAHQRLKEGHRV